MLILVTGFEPFGGAATNASWEAVRRLPESLPVPPSSGGDPGPRMGVAVERRLLPVSFERAPRELMRLVETLRPDAVVCTGVAGGRVEVAVERGARNLAHAGRPDEDGTMPREEPLVPTGPARVTTSLPVERLVDAVARHGVPVRASEDAGLFVCNATYHALLHAAGESSPGPGGLTPAGVFVHVPAEVDLATDRVVEALEALVVELADIVWELERPGSVLREGGARAVELRPVVLPEDRAVRIGVSGGIGCGKSTLTAALAGLGAVVADADVLARQVVEPGSPGLAAVVAAFGPDVLTEEGSLDRAHLGRLVFSDPGARSRLEGITHPLIAAAAERVLAAAPVGTLAVYDVPLLVENSMEGLFDVVVMVDAPLDLRLERLWGRGMPPAEALARIGAQASVAQRREVTTVWVDNAGTPEDLRAVATEVVDTWLTPDHHA